MRKLILAVAGLLAALGGGLALVLLLVDVNQFRGTIQAGLEKQLRRSVTMGALGLKLFPLAVTAENVEIGESARFATGRPFVRVKALGVRVGLLSLLRKDIRVDSIVLRQPAIELVRNAAGEWNYSDLSGGASGGGGGSVTLSGLRIEDGAIAIDQLGKAKARSVYDRLDIELSGAAPDKTFRLKAAARLPGAGKGGLALEARGVSAGPIEGRLTLGDAALSGLARYAGTTLPIDGTLSGSVDLRYERSSAAASGRLDLKGEVPLRLDFRLQQDLASGKLRASEMRLSSGKFSIEGSADIDTRAETVSGRASLAKSSLGDLLAVARLFGAGDLTGSGVVSLDAGVKGPLAGPLAWSGSGTLSDAKISSPELAKPLEVKSAGLKFEQQSAIISPLQCSMAGSTLRGSLAVRNFASPGVTFDFDIDRIDAAEWQKAVVSGKPAAPAAQGPAPVRTSPSPLAAKGTVKVGTILAQGLTLTAVRSECAFERGTLTLSPLTAQLFGGTHSGSITLDTRSQPPLLSTDLKLEKVDADRLLTATTSVKHLLYGLLAASGNARLKLGGGDDVARSLNGALGIRLSQGRLAGTNVLNQLSSVSKFLGYSQSAQTFTNLVQLSGDIKIVDGLASTDNLQVLIEGGSLAGAGTINLATQALNLKVTAVLDRDTSQKVGGSKVGGFLETALANNKGELVIPALVTGTMAQPRFAPDAALVAEMKLKTLLPSVSNPGSMLGGAANARGAGQSLLEALTGKPGATRQQQASPDKAAEKPAEAPPAKKSGARGLLDSLINRK